MKFSEIKIGAKILSPNLYVFIKLDEENVSFINDDGRWDTIKCEDDSDWQLITKCKNCKHYDETCESSLNMILKTSKLILGERLFSSYHQSQDPETFSCSLFEMKCV